MKHAFVENVLEDFDKKHVITLLKHFTYKDCKVFLWGPELATKKFSTLNQTALTGVLKEEWFGTNYRKIKKIDID